MAFVEVTRPDGCDGVAVLTMNAPDSLNAIGTVADCDDFVAALEAVQADKAVRAAVLTGAGRAFCTGGNLKAMAAGEGIGPGPTPADTRNTYRRGVQRVVRALHGCEVPLVAAVNGHAVGLGLDIACLADVRLVADGARLAASFIKVGLVPGDGGAWALARVVGYPKAAELFLTGDPFHAAEAVRIGLAARAVAADALMSEALALAGRMAANPGAALRLTKRLLREAQTAEFAAVLELSAAYQAIAHETADHREAVRAFAEKRPPVFER